jgi:hypothetical protein
MELLGDVGHVKSYFGPFGDECWCQCMIGVRFALNVENILDALDGSPS